MEEKKRKVKLKAIRLLKKDKLFSAVFSRATIVFILILLQLWLISISFGWLLGEYRVFFQIFEAVITVASVLYLVNSRMDTTSKITWLVMIMLAPLLGSLFLLYTKQDLGYRTLRRRLKEVILNSSNLLQQDEEVVQELSTQHSTAYNLVEYLRRSDNKFPVYKGTSVTYLPTGESFFAKMKEEMLKAKQFIFLEYFIIDEGLMWGEILAILKQKASEGVEIRVLYDGMNELSRLSFDYTERLGKLGIQARAFAPITPFLSTYYNYRDHRKILVIDGQVAFNGGANLADEYINEIERFGHWKDAGVLLKGPAVDSFTVLFLQMWTSMGSDESLASYIGLAQPVDKTDGYVIPYGDSPLDRDNVGENVYIDMLNHAREYVHIMTPYLILSSELEHAIRFAAERGVDVKLMMPGIPDKKIPYALAKTYYKILMDSGVEIYEYTPGFNHSKVFVADGVKAVVGTINLDYRSLYHHFECATYLYRSPAVAAVEADFQQTLLLCHRVTPDELSQLPILMKLTGVFAKVVAPLL
ncbi:phospholipase D-like domain-containing protein [Streptococcus entericus]|uniref:phospholipase D-like domain-containing protein n=1 Tax=Streptococcus entericus TaxID=155680 RepID=UPI00036C933C|nr:phospholipase D-like domain-containing protein [Streptococcus entericus]